MAVALEDKDLIIPIKNIDKCESLGGFQKFMESQKDRIGIDIWYDDHLYRESDDPNSATGRAFWQNHGLEPYVDDDSHYSNNYIWNDFCVVDDLEVQMNINRCRWLEIDPIECCAWLKGQDRGETVGNKEKMAIISETFISREICEELQNRFDALTNNIGARPPRFLKYFSRRNEKKKRQKKFDVNNFLIVFDRIKLNRGYKLDYVYMGDSIGGYPLVFTRLKLNILNNITKKSEALREAIFESSSHEQPHVKDISFEQSPIGYFQFCLFSVAITQFYLWWHARDTHVELIITRNQIDSILRDLLRRELRHEDQKDQLDILLNNKKSIDDYSHFIGLPFSEEELSKLYAIPLDPCVRLMQDGYGEVHMISYSEYRGFYRHIFYIKWPCHIGSRRVLIARYPYMVNY